MDKISFETFCDVYYNDIISDLENEIKSLDLPKQVCQELLEVILENETEILEYKFQQIIDRYSDDSYSEFKESKLV